MFGFTKEENAVLKRLSTPTRIQDFLDTLPQNFDEGNDTLMSPRRVLRERKAHCIEGALLAATALWMHGKPPFLLDLKTTGGDQDHVVALFKENGYWGAISKTNHAILRYRDPIHRSIRELALTYFHEYFLSSSGKKTLVSYSRPFSLKGYGTSWMTEEEDLWDIGAALDDIRHFPLVPAKNKKLIRPAGIFERRGLDRVEWNARGQRTKG
ncbi:MAG: hypothetical protein ABA06_04505 [Parcubacteria bacterium C7867-001]|nr:MAG: hypothetical protein ABA06_04505 [Parcubacteria bacterium C7867-001]